MVSSKLYVEGGGDSKALRTACRRGFRKFFENSGLRGQLPRIVPCGSRENAYDDFVTALQNDDSRAMLLVDAECPVKEGTRWQHVDANDDWKCPTGATEEQCHLMVQVMETWFLADRASLSAYFGQHFNERALPRNTNIEKVSKSDLFKGLENATRGTQKGKYSKAAHSFEILGELDASRVESASPHAKALLDALRG